MLRPLVAPSALIALFTASCGSGNTVFLPIPEDVSIRSIVVIRPQPEISGRAGSADGVERIADVGPIEDALRAETLALLVGEPSSRCARCLSCEVELVPTGFHGRPSASIALPDGPAMASGAVVWLTPISD